MPQFKRTYAPIEAAALLEKHYGGTARSLIADNLKDGRIQAFAERVWVSHQPTLTAVWHARDEEIEDAECDVAVEKEVWRRGRFWLEDLGNWRWDDARFVITRRKTAPADRTILEGVRFDADQIDALLPTPKKPPGRSAKQKAWGYLACEIVDLYAKGKLRPGSFKSKNKLVEELAVKMEEAPKDFSLSQQSIEMAIDPIWERFCSGYSPPDEAS